MKAIFVFWLVAVSSVSPVVAAPPVPAPDIPVSSRLRPKWVDARVDVRKVLAEFARCSVRSAPEISLEMLFAADTGRDAFFQSIAPDCLTAATWSVDEGPVQLSMQPTVIRFTFADAIFARELSNSDPGPLPNAPPLTQPQLDESQFANARTRARTPAALNNVENAYRRAKIEIPYYAFGECVVRTDAAASKALLLTKVETEEEARAIEQLLPTLGKCQPKPAILSMDKADVRGTVAFNYLRLAAATNQLPSKGTKR